MLPLTRMQPGDLCLVTGVSGYLGSWLAKYLLLAGMRVRGTVRSVSDPARNAALAKVLPGIELAAADLRSADGWPEAVQGCRWVFHVASPQAVSSEKDRTGGAVQGTEHLMRAALAGPTVEKIVLTSSEAAIAYGHPRAKTRFTEDDWTDVAGPAGRSDYFRSKTLAEQLAWRMVRDPAQNPRGVPLSVINPSFIAGPTLVPWARFSLEAVRGLALGTTPLIDMTNRLVDVRDCAQMHIALMDQARADGHRHFSFAIACTPRELIGAIRRNYAAQGFGRRTMVLGRGVAALAGLFMGDAAAIASRVGAPSDYETLWPDVYRYRHTDLDQLVCDTVDSLLQQGWLTPRSAR